jgi:hypothetical protein
MSKPMAINDNSFAGKPIKLFQIEEGIVDPTSFAYTIHYLDEEGNGPPYWLEKWLAFINDPRVSEVSALVIGGDMEQVGQGESCAPQIESLVSGREKLSALTSLFLEGSNRSYEEEDDMLFAIPDVSPIFLAFPQLEVLGLYGWTNMPGAEFQIGTVHSEVLRALTIATGWLHPRILHDLWRAHLPALEHLELWLYDDGYHPHPPTMADLEPLFSGTLFPHLRSLALCLSPMEDDLAVALAASPLLERLKVLELSNGILTDRGAQALLASSALRQLERLVIWHHYCSDEMVQQLRALPLEVEIGSKQEVGKHWWNRVPQIYHQFHITPG